jgi:PIN domain nuclease of toxin-antitoxin system
MRLLLDTNIVVDLTSRQGYSGFSEPDIFDAAVGFQPFLVSVVSIWEIDIKSRLKKLRLSVRTEQLSDMVRSAGGMVLDVSEDHILARLESEPDTKDPFDRLLLTTAAAEGALLVTRNRMLQNHPLAWKPSFPT